MAAPIAPSRRTSRTRRKRRIATTTPSIRRAKIARAQLRIKSGYYERHDALIDLAVLRMLSDLDQHA